MAIIKLTRNQETVVDDIDSDLSSVRWYAQYNFGSWYAQYKHKFVLRLHRVIMSRILRRDLTKNEQVDHIDGNTLNNRRNNLRLATAAQNAMNHSIRKNNTSGYTGVCFDQKYGKWKAYLNKNRKCVFVAFFDNKQDAIEARKQAEIEYFGEFRRYK